MTECCCWSRLGRTRVADESAKSVDRLGFSFSCLLSSLPIRVYPCPSVVRFSCFSLCSSVFSVVNLLCFFSGLKFGARKETEHSHARVLVPQPSVDAGKAVLKLVRQLVHGPRSFDRRLLGARGALPTAGGDKASIPLPTHTSSCSSPEMPDHTRPPHVQCASALSQELCVFPRRFMGLLGL